MPLSPDQLDKLFAPSTTSKKNSNGWEDYPQLFGEGATKTVTDPIRLVGRMVGNNDHETLDKVDQGFGLFKNIDPKTRRSFWGQAASGAGNLAGLIGLGMINPAAAAASAIGQNAEQVEQDIDVKAPNATTGQRVAAGLLGGVVGASDLILPRMLTKGVDLPKKAANTLLRKMITGAAVEGGQEGAQQVANNAIAKGVYNPDQDMTEGVGESALLGALIGGPAGAFLHGHKAAPLPEPSQEAQDVLGKMKTADDGSILLPNGEVIANKEDFLHKYDSLKGTPSFDTTFGDIDSAVKDYDETAQRAAEAQARNEYEQSSLRKQIDAHIDESTKEERTKLDSLQKLLEGTDKTDPVYDTLFKEHEKGAKALNKKVEKTIKEITIAESMRKKALDTDDPTLRKELLEKADKISKIRFNRSLVKEPDLQEAPKDAVVPENIIDADFSEQPALTNEGPLAIEHNPQMDMFQEQTRVDGRPTSIVEKNNQSIPLPYRNTPNTSGAMSRLLNREAGTDINTEASTNTQETSLPEGNTTVAPTTQNASEGSIGKLLDREGIDPSLPDALNKPQTIAGKVVVPKAIIKTGKLTDVVKHLSNYPELDSTHKELIAHILKLAPKTKIRFGDRESVSDRTRLHSNDGLYDPNTNEILLHPDKILTLETILHEAVHGITANKLASANVHNLPIARDIQQLHKEIYDKLKDHPSHDVQYLISNADEMMAGGSTNVPFQNALRAADNKGRNLLQRFWDATRKLLGVPQKQSVTLRSLLDKTYELAHTDEVATSTKGKDDLNSVSEFPNKRKERSAKDLKEQLDQLYADKFGKVPLDEFTAQSGPLQLDLIKAQRREQREANTNTINEIHPGFTTISNGTKVLATHGLTYTEPTKGTVVGSKMVKFNDGWYNVPKVDFGDGRPRTVDKYGIKEVFAPRSIKPDLGMIPDHEDKSAISEAVTTGVVKNAEKVFDGIRNFYQSVTDNLSKTPYAKVKELSDRIRNRINDSARIYGTFNDSGYLAAAKIYKDLPFIFAGTRTSKQTVDREFRNYFSEYTLGNQKKAAQMLVDMSDETKNIIKGVTSSLKYSDQELINSGLKVKDKGRWRPYKGIQNYFPLMLNEEIRTALRSPDLHPEKALEISKKLEATGRKTGGTVEGLKKFLEIEYQGDYYGSVFGNIEKGRTNPFPADFYDISVDAVSQYRDSMSKRVSQIINYGQGIGRTTTQDLTPNDVFEDAMEEATGQNEDLVKYIKDVRNYEYDKVDSKLHILDTLNTAATGLQMANPVTIFTNMFSGVGNNYANVGFTNAAKAMKKLAVDYKDYKAEGVRLGIVKDNYSNIIKDAATLNVPKIVRDLTSIALNNKLAGVGISYNESENIPRLHAMLAAQENLTASKEAINKNPNAVGSKAFLELLNRERIDKDKLFSGDLQENDKYLRRMVNLYQGSYDIDQNPMWINSQAGRFLFKYHKFIQQMTRNLDRGIVSPSIKQMKESQGTDKAKALLPILTYMAATTLVGVAMDEIKDDIFGVASKLTDLEDFQRMEEKDQEGFVRSLWNDFIQTQISSGGLGYFGYAYQLSDDINNKITKGQDPMAGALESAPGMVLPIAIINAGIKTAVQGPSADTFIDAMKNSISAFRVGKQTLLNFTEKSGVETLENNAKLQEALYVKQMNTNLVTRWKKDNDKNLLQTSNVFGTEATPINRNIYKEIMFGNPQTARSIAAEAVKSGEIKKQSITSYLNKVHPLSIDGQDNKNAFMKWYVNQVDEDQYNKTVGVVKRFEDNGIKSGLLTTRTQIPQWK